MSDFLQTPLHTLAVQNPVFSSLAVFAANYLLFAGVLALGLMGLFNRKKLTWGTVARVAVGLAVALIFTQILGRLILDVRPYIAEHYAPLAPVSTDNGFPSDHTLVAALMSGLVLWLDRRWFGWLALLTLLVGLGRLAIGAHHTLDVVGSVLIAAVSLVVARWVPLRAAVFERRVLASKA